MRTMADKKDPGKFTVRFNIHDPQHQTVVALLNQQGRNKAQFLASLPNRMPRHYTNGKEPPTLQVPPVDPETLEKIIVSILEKRDKQKRGGDVPQRTEKACEISPAEAPQAKEESENWFGSAGEVSAILDSLKMFDNL